MAARFPMYVSLYCYCSVQLGPMLWHISVKKPQTATFIYHAITTFVSALNMSLKCHIYATCANHLICIHGGMLIYMAHMKLLVSKTWPGVLYTYNPRLSPQCGKTMRTTYLDCTGYIWPNQPNHWPKGYMQTDCKLNT